MIYFLLTTYCFLNPYVFFDVALPSNTRLTNVDTSGDASLVELTCWFVLNNYLAIDGIIPGLNFESKGIGEV